MNILLTGDSGDLGSLLAKQFENSHVIKRLDIIPPKDAHGVYIQGSILDREVLALIYHLVIYVGFPAALNALGMAKEVFDEMKVTH